MLDWSTSFHEVFYFYRICRPICAVCECEVTIRNHSVRWKMMLMMVMMKSSSYNISYFNFISRFYIQIDEWIDVCASVCLCVRLCEWKILVETIDFVANRSFFFKYNWFISLALFMVGTRYSNTSKTLFTIDIVSSETHKHIETIRARHCTVTIATQVFIE